MPILRIIKKVWIKFLDKKFGREYVLRKYTPLLRYKGVKKEIGYKIEIRMTSGKIAIYKLNKIENIPDTDLYWCYFRFDHYKLSVEPSYPRYA